MPLPLIPLVLGLPVLAICSAVAHVTGQDWPKLRNMFYFPLGGTTRGSHHATQRQRLLQRLGGTNLRLVTRDNRAVSAVYAEPDRPVRTDVAVILIGANAMVLDDMVEYAEFYLHRLRVPVLMLSLWGYPDPINPAIDSSAAAAEEASSSAIDGSADESAPLQPKKAKTDLSDPCPTELSVYLDCEAAYAHLVSTRNLRPDGILVHGVSIGGAVGASLAINHPGVRMTFDQPFCSLREVTWHMTSNVVDGFVARYLTSKGALRTLKVVRLCVLPALSRAVAFLLVRMCFKKGLGGEEDGCATTDMLENVAKAARIEGPVFVIYAEADEMMHPDAFRRILVARYKLHKGEAIAKVRRHSASLEGGHMSFFGEHPEACAAYEAYLRESGFLPRSHLPGPDIAELLVSIQGAP